MNDALLRESSSLSYPVVASPVPSRPNCIFSLDPGELYSASSLSSKNLPERLNSVQFQESGNDHMI